MNYRIRTLGGCAVQTPGLGIPEDPRDALPPHESRRGIAAPFEPSQHRATDEPGGA